MKIDRLLMIAERLDVIARGAHVTNAIRASQISDAAKDLRILARSDESAAQPTAEKIEAAAREIRDACSGMGASLSQIIPILTRHFGGAQEGQSRIEGWAAPIDANTWAFGKDLRPHLAERATLMIHEPAPPGAQEPEGGKEQTP